MKQVKFNSKQGLRRTYAKHVYNFVVPVNIFIINSLKKKKVLIRSPKLSNVGRGQYLDDWPLGNTTCSWHKTVNDPGSRRCIILKQQQQQQQQWLDFVQINCIFYEKMWNVEIAKQNGWENATIMAYDDYVYVLVSNYQCYIT